ncbi:serologically defined colon cancer antigen 8 homolog isoform X2 [Chelonus insularis]|uniref:serologically defined colon cancer antigen 8 homolog isoform X2 n=1 Tax=Chelonus insularis TaxID=460826 RepID=UPI001589FCF9|nr:serologically defined colon cancer antigen 8 homolog isoform X2 [Chelonus insularis]
MLTTSNYPRRCRMGGTSTFGVTSPGILSSRSKLLVRSYYKPRNTSNFTHIENAPFGRPKRFKIRRINSFQKMDTTKKKIPDYTDTVYREAVSRLKCLLAESYTSRSGKVLRDRSIYRRSNTKLHESGDETDERSISECSKGLSTNLLLRENISDKNRLPLTSALMTDDSQISPKELSTLIMRQEEYIEQLESESQFCKDELKNLLEKIREVVAENEALHDKNKTTLLKSFLNEFDSNKDTKRIDGTKHINLHDGEFSSGKKIKLHQVTEGPSIIFESRISELEAQLTQARIELRKAQEENQNCIKKMSEGGSSSSSPETMAQLDQLMKEKRELNSKLDEALRNLKSVREKEMEATQKAKRAQDLAQQAEFDKSQLESEIRRLKDELERQRDKIREATQDTSRRLAEERHQVERRYSQQVEQLTADIATHWDAASKSQLEIDKQRREIADLKRELNQKQAMNDDLKKEMLLKTSNLQSDINQLAAEKDAVEQELATVKLAAERNERHARQEQSRCQIEINSYKQRLERADVDIVHCRRENLRLSEQIASLEKELNMEKIAHASEGQTPAATPRVENEKDLTSMIMEMETKHGKSPGTESSIEPSPNQNVTSHGEDINTGYSLNDNQNYSHLYNESEQNKNQVTDSSQFTSEENENYQDYASHDPNYQGQYSNESYQQYEQYDPSFYQQESGDNNQPNQLDQQQYDNYASNDYIDNQHESVTNEQSYEDNDQNKNVSK